MHAIAKDGFERKSGILQGIYRFHRAWAGLDSNQRRRKPADLQSAPFGHFGTYPRDERLI
jgi:hypothetical protein